MTCHRLTSCSAAKITDRPRLLYRRSLGKYLWHEPLHGAYRVKRVRAFHWTAAAIRTCHCDGHEMELRDQLQQTLGDAYAVERELVGGGMARVFVAYDRTLGRRVVIKTIVTDLPTSLSADRFRREIKLTAALQQANIVPVLSAGEVNGVPYYMMPFVEGESLRGRLAHGAVPFGEAVSILRDVARALSFAHDRGVVHRDIKPENVLLSGSTAVVTDFGIAKAIEASQTNRDATALTHFGTALGTPAYISPEQAAGDPHVDHRADIYALGVVAYELLAGAPPFSGRSAPALMAAHITEQPPDLAERCRDAPRAVTKLVMQCLEKDPERRPQSASNLLDLLQAASVQPNATVAGTASKPSIAVLPFANLSPDPADEYFADGLTDEVITDLAGIRSLHVIARASMMRFKGQGKDPVTVARELQVRYALDGSVRRAGSSLRMTARLIDATDGSTLWSDKLGGAVDDVFAMQEQVSRTIVDALKLTLSPQEARRLAERPLADLRAYEAFLQARQAVWLFTVPSFERAAQLLENALELVGDNALLLGALGHVHALFLETGAPDAALHLDMLERCASRIAALAPDAFELHWLRGLSQFKRGEIREAIASLGLARALQPNNADVAAMQAYMLLLSGRDDAARDAANDCVALDPLTPLFQCMPGFCDWMLGRYDSAIPYYRAYLANDPVNPSAHLYLIFALANGGVTAEARERSGSLGKLFAGTVYGEFGTALSLALQGKPREGRAAVTAAMVAAASSAETFARILAEFYALVGDQEAAIDSLENAVRMGQSNYPYLATHSQLLAPLRSHPRFREVLQEVRARWERGGASRDDHARTTQHQR